MLPMKGLLTLGLCIAAATASPRSNLTAEKTGRIFSLFNRVTFKNELCSGTGEGDNEATMGVCVSAEECNDSNGVKTGNCAAGFGTCCLITTDHCGGTITKNNTYIRNEEYPMRSTKERQCNYKLERKHSHICFMRLDFVMLEVAPPDYRTAPAAPTHGGCTFDEVTFTQGNGNFAHPICGNNNGQHMYLDAGPEDKNRHATFGLSLTGTDNARVWNVRVAQIPCGKDYTPWQNCRQYFTENAGNFKSYNYDGMDGHLNDQEYVVCVRRNKGNCKISYQAAATTKSFKFDQASDNEEALVGWRNCRVDYVTILFSTGAVQTCNENGNNLHGNAEILINTEFSHRYCGGALSCTTRTTGQRGEIIQHMSPFEFNVRTNPREPTSANTNPNTDYGANIDFLQIPC